MSEAQQIYDELHAVLRRWMAEGDELKAFEVIGALEAVKADYMDTLKRHNEELFRCENCDKVIRVGDEYSTTEDDCHLCKPCAEDSEEEEANKGAKS